MKIAAAYIRVSTNDQTELSPATQVIEIKKYAKSNGYLVPDEYIFLEGDGKKGYTGKNADKRPAFQEMIATAKVKPKPFDAILLWKFSRFARNADESTYYKSVLRKKLGIDVISISEPIEEGMYGRLVEMIIEWSDEFYSWNLAGEVIRGMTEKARRGEFASYAPIGYKMENKQLIPDPATADTVRKVFEDFNNGKIIHEIMRDMQAAGIRTRYGNLPDHRFVLYILRNPVYAGYVVWSKKGRRSRDYDLDKENIIIQEGIHEPLISKDLYEQTKAKLDKLKERFENKQKSYVPREYMLRGLVKCSNCGSTLTRNTDGLQCCTYSRGACTHSHFIKMNKITEMVITQLTEDARNGKIKVEPVRESNTCHKTATDDRVAREQNKLARARTAYEEGVYTLEEYRTAKESVEKRIAEIRSEQTHEAPKNKKEIQRNIRNFLDSLSSLSAREANLQLRDLVTKIIFFRNPKNPDRIEIFYKS